MKGLSVRWVALLCVVASATVAAVEVWPAAQRFRTQDRNGDGRPDVWRHYDDKGVLTDVAVDSNFDGRADIQEYYERGALVRRESDRNFNGQADLIEEFDADTHNETRSVVDVDYDGTADLLVLFRDGRPVFSKRACPKSSQISTPRRPTGRETLAPLSDPFESDLTIRANHVTPGAEVSVGLSTSGGLPRPRITAIGRLPASARVVARDIHADALVLLPSNSTRAPPTSL